MSERGFGRILMMVRILGKQLRLIRIDINVFNRGATIKLYLPDRMNRSDVSHPAMVVPLLGGSIIQGAAPAENY